MGPGKTVNQTLYFIFIVVLAGILLTACSDKTTTDATVEKQKTATKVEEKSTENKKPVESTSQNAPKNDTQKTETVPATSASDKALTLHEFINRWNKIEPNQLSGEITTVSVANGIISGWGKLGDSGSTYGVELNQKDNTIKMVTLYSAYTLSEKDEKRYIGNETIHNINVLIDVLQPELNEKEKEKILTSLGVYEKHLIPKASIKVGKVTYTADTGDDRFRLDAAYEN